MFPRSPAIFGTMALIAAVVVAPFGAVMAQGAPSHGHLIPQALLLQQKETIEQLSGLGQKRAPVGPAASKVLVLMKRHMEREREFILPPLTLLPLLADGKVTSDMAWALPMTDRVKAEREQIFEEHTQITEALNELIVAATRTHDNTAREFTQSAAADSLEDLEILEPALLLIGDTLRAKLPAGH